MTEDTQDSDKRSRPQDRIPLELVDQIIGFAAGDATSIGACNLTCRTWLTIGRSHIFRQVKITDEHRLTVLEDLLQAAPSLNSFIRELVVGPFPGTIKRTGIFRGVKWVTRIPEILPQYLMNLHTIRFVRLSDAGEFCDGEFFGMLYYFVTVKRLVLDDCAMNTSVLQAFASALPSLTELHVNELLPLMVTIWDAPPQLDIPCLTSLVIDLVKTPSPMLNNLVDWLLSSSSRETLRSVELGFTVLDAKVVNRCLRGIGPTLEHLGLRLKNMFESSEWEHELIQREVDIAICTNLISLTIDFVTLAPTMAFLEEVKADYLQTLSFHVYVSELGPQPHFEPLLRRLSEAPFHRLRELRFIQHGKTSVARVEQMVSDATPNFHSRRLVHFLSGREAT